jgi:hypothetical protein
MSELTLVGLHEDGEHVVLEGPDGQRFRLPIDEALRAAVRRDRAQLEQVRAELTGVVSPREIQSRIRAGASADAVAEESGMPVELVRRYEGPVLAEREFVAAKARGSRIGRDTGAPVLGDLVTDRLATRGVEASPIRWDAYRSGSGPWTVEVLFVVSDAERSARWTYEQGTRSVRATDDEARWLSETELADEPIPRRHLASVRSAVFDVEVDEALRPVLAAVDQPGDRAPEPDRDESTHALLDDLTGRRGIRQQLDAPDEDDGDGDEFEGFGPQHTFDFENPHVTVPASVPSSVQSPVPGAHPPASRPDLATDAQVLEMPSGHRSRLAGEQGATKADGDGPDAPGGTEEHPAQGRRPRKGRASVPSWDEIVFGAKPE